MGGLLVLTLIAAYIWGTAKFVKSVSKFWQKALIVVAEILIPTADAVYGRIKLKQMCEAKGGLHIYRVVEVEGFERWNGQPTEDLLTRDRYRFVEGKGIDGKPIRLTMNPDGAVLRESVVELRSEYQFQTRTGTPGDAYYWVEWTVSNRKTDEVIGRFVNIGYEGGWFERFVNGLYAAGGAVAMCGANMSSTEFVTKILKLINQEKTK